VVAKSASWEVARPTARARRRFITLL